SIIWRFFDIERVHRLTLTSEAITLEAASYTSREDFLQRFAFILEALTKTIKPSLAQRIGFRYFNRISEEGNALSHLSEMIEPELLGLLRPPLAEHINISMSEFSGSTKEGKIIRSEEHTS